MAARAGHGECLGDGRAGAACRRADEREPLMSYGGLPRDSDFALLTYRVEGERARAGLVVGDEVYDLAQATGNARLAYAGDVLANWDTSLRELRRAAETRDR